MRLMQSKVFYLAIISICIASVLLISFQKPLQLSSALVNHDRNLSQKEIELLPNEIGMIDLSNINAMEKIYKKDLRKNIIVPKLDWSNLVVVILTYDNYESKRLIQAHFDTWIKKAGIGLDIVFVTDNDDKRPDDEVIPRNIDVLANIHLYRSPAEKEGSRARSKVIDAFDYAYTEFAKDKNKYYFLKIDPDSYILPEHLLNTLSRVHDLTYPLPVDFGKSVCSTTLMCYTEGGLYAMSRKGFELALYYIMKHPDIFEKTVLPKKETNNLNIHEDFFTSFAFWKATGYPVIESKELSGKFFTPRWHETSVSSIHPVKNYKDFYVLEKIFYDKEGLPRKGSFEHKYHLLLPLTTAFETKCLNWDSEKGELVEC